MTRNNDQQLIDLVSLSTTLPDRRDPECRRDSVLATIDTLFSAGYKSVLLAGNSGTGKTTTLRQYVENAPHDAVNLFIDPRSSYSGSYDLAVSELAAQLYFSLYGTVPAEGATSPAFVREIVPDLARQRRIQDRPLTFVIDGLFDLDPRNNALVKEILGLLPTNLNCIRFLFSASTENVKDAKHHWPSLEVQAIQPLNPDETRSLLQPFLTDTEHIASIHQATAGNAGQIASIIRLLKSGVPLAEILEAKPQELREYYEIEWSNVQLGHPGDLLALAVIVFLPSSLTVKEVAEIADVDEHVVAALLEKITFLGISENEGDCYPTIDSYPFRRFLEDKLHDYRTKAIDSAVTYFQQYVGDIQSADRISALLQLKGDHRALVDHLTSEVIDKKLRSSHSVLAVTELLRQGFEASTEIVEPRQQLSFSLVSSALNNLLDNDALTQQVDHYISQDDFGSALRFARSIFSIETRLLALARVAREMTKHEFTINDELLNEIYGYVRDVSPQIPEDRALDIGSELVAFDQSSAVDLLNAVSKREGETNSFDLLITRLAERTLQRSDSDAYENLYETAKGGVSDSLWQHLSVLRSLFRTAGPSTDAVGQIQALHSTDQKTFFTRAHLRSNAERPEKIDLALSVLETIIADAEYSPNATTYSDFSESLTEVDSKTDASDKLARLLRGQLASIWELGPTTSYYKVRLNLLIYSSNTSGVIPDDDLIELLDELATQKLYPDVELSCLVQIRKSQRRVANQSKNYIEIDSLISDRIDQCITRAVTNLAEHDTAVLPAAYAEFCDLSAGLFELASRLNTEYRRDALLRTCIREYARDLAPENVDAQAIRYVWRVIDSIQNDNLRANAYGSIGRAFCESLRREHGRWNLEADGERESIGSALVPFFLEHARDLLHPYDAALHAADIMYALEAVGIELDDKETVELESIVTSQISAAEAVDGTKRVLLDLANYPAAPITRILDQYFDENVSSEIFRSSCLVEPMAALTNLAVRVIAGMFREGRAAISDVLDDARDIVGCMHGELPQCMAWVHLAGLLTKFDREDQAKVVLETNVFPIYFDLKDKEHKHGVLTFNVLANAAPVLWRTHRELFDDEIAQFSTKERDRIYRKVVRYITKRTVYGEPDPPSSYWYPIQYDDMVACAQLMTRTTEDAAIWASFDDLLEAEKEHRAFRRLNNRQKSSIVSKLQYISENKLPADGGVSHEGFKVLVEIATDVRFARKRWELPQIQARVEGIGNTSDCAYMYCELIGIIPSGQNELRRGLIELATQKIEKIPSAGERLARAIVLVKESRLEFPALIREKVDSWMQASLYEESHDVLTNQRELVDTAYSLDSDWGNALAALGDREGVNTRTRNALQRERERFDREEDVRSQNWKEVPKEDIREVTDIFWRGLGLMTAQGYSVLEQGDREVPLRMAAEHELEITLPIYAFHCEVQRKRTPTDRRNGAALQILGDFKRAAHLCLSAVDGPIGSKVNDARRGQEEGPKNFQFAGPGGRVEALAFLQEWVRNRVNGELTIVDPYFTLDQLEVIRAAQEGSPTVEIYVVGGPQLLDQQKSGVDIADHFQRVWSEKFERERPPSLTISIPFLDQDRSSPIHDRWILTESEGLKLGTSLNGLGERESSISEISKAEFLSTIEMVRKYRKDEIRWVKGARVRTATLPIA